MKKIVSTCFKIGFGFELGKIIAKNVTMNIGYKLMDRILNEAQKTFDNMDKSSKAYKIVNTIWFDNSMNEENNIKQINKIGF